MLQLLKVCRPRRFDYGKFSCYLRCRSTTTVWKSKFNRITPSGVYTITNVKDAVKIRPGGWDDIEPLSIPALLERVSHERGNKIALVSKPNENGKSQHLTFKEYHAKVLHVAQAFIKLGLQPHYSVGIISVNCPEWLLSHMGAIHAGGISAGIYPTNSPEAVLHVLEHSRANLVIVDDSKQMRKIRQIRDKLPLLKAAVQIEGPFEEFVENENGYYKWSDIDSMDVIDAQDELQNRLNSIAINKCCSLIYTSGTTGTPKGVMLSHDNVLFSARAGVKRFPDVIPGDERIVSYLPLCHIAAQYMDIYIASVIGATVYFADRDVLKGTLINALKRVRPTFFGGTPRVFGKMEEALLSAESNTNLFRRYIISSGRQIVMQHCQNSWKGSKSSTILYRIANHFVANKLKAALGLDAVRTISLGAAPTSDSTKKYFLSLGLKIKEGYGASESGGVHTVFLATELNWTTVGMSVPYTEIKILNTDEKGHGEICLRGRNIFMGYLADDEKTKEAVDEEGWFHTGDLGYLDSKGNLYVTGRLKELIITAGGKNISPVHVEDLVKEQLPELLSNAVLVGDQRKYLTILVTLKTQMDPETGAPLDALQDSTVRFIRETLDLDYTTVTDILNAGPCPQILRFIEQGIERANGNAISNAERVQKFAILPHDFSIPTGELGPTLKIRRYVVYEKYIKLINALYEEETNKVLIR